MQIFAQVSNQGTAMPETALCRVHRETHFQHFARTRDQGNGKLLDDFSWHDCTGNDELSCNVCGTDNTSADLIGKTVARMEFGSYFGDDPNVLIEAPSTTLFFTDGTTHTFLHPQEVDA